MKAKTLSALAGLGGALILSAGANAAPHLTVVSMNHEDQFHVDNGLVTFVIGVTGFEAGENLQGFIGTAGNPWSITNTGGGFFNVDSTSYFDGMGQAAGNPLAGPNGLYDSGVLANPLTNALGAITSGGASNPVGFAQFGVGATSGTGADVFWLTLNPAGLEVNGTVNLFRLTMPTTATGRITGLMVTNLGNQTGNEYAIDFTFAVPGPGSLALLGIAGLAGGSRRRRA